MSIRKRFVRSNVAIVIIPSLLFLLIEGYLLLYMLDFGGSGEGNQHLTFTFIHLIGWLLLLLISNSLFIYYVGRYILKPMKKLTQASEEISSGQLDTPFVRMRKDEIGKLSDSFEEMRLQLIESLEVKEKYMENRRKLIDNLSNDLKNPVTYMKEQVEEIRSHDRPLPEQVKTPISNIHMKTIVIERMIDELFQHSQLDMGRLSFRYRKVDMREFLIEVMAEFETEWDEVVFTFKAEEVKPYFARIDTDQLRRVLVHIMNNSLKYMDKEEKKIDILLKEKKGEITVEVTDNGHGILDNDLPHIFELFYQSEETKKFIEGGSGLGLPVSKRIIEEHEGMMKAASRIGHGTTISFTLPAYQ
ncbi:cell wall metabolism sensor histidine kinase WalK [Halobacillus sp. Marseille-Q1614]|uniref:sensor histidine kinase n=1 Tax=Halobacillus sp. Marseille-Q1614 TaxID=2709134 RepID=UPI00156D7294|nr:HAMP domain-containing sensor histidine kinase [Halobacillus sp. Marseille-Q1614]